MASAPKAGSPKATVPGAKSPTAPIIMLDNDECVGSWGDLSLLYTVYTHVLHVAPPVDMFAQLLTATGCARPHLRTLYDTIMQLKTSGHVSSVYMVTSARDTVGWVSFLRQVLEAWYGAPIYDGVIEGNMIAKYNTDHGRPVADACGSVFKDMNQVREAAGVSASTRVLCLDDRPGCISNGEAFGVSPYTVAVNLVEVCREFVGEWSSALESRYAWTLQETWRSFHRDPSHFTVAWRDTCLLKATEFLKTNLHAGSVMPSSPAVPPPATPDRTSSAPSTPSHRRAAAAPERSMNPGSSPPHNKASQRALRV